MPILDNPFSCPNGHNFNANAKIRARCPECGERASRKFDVDEPDKPKDTHHEAKPPIEAPVLLRRGKVVPAKKPPVKPAAKKPVVAKKPVSNGLVSSKRITTKGATPQIKRPPAKTAVARHIKGGAPDRRNKSFMDNIIERFGPH